MNFANVINIRIPQGEVIQIQDSLSRILWKKSSPYSTPFYVEDMSGSENTVSIVKSSDSDTAPTLTIEYSTDRVNWSILGTTSKTAITASIPAYGRVYLRCKTSIWANSIGSVYYNHINISNNCIIGGNIMSLLYGSDFTGEETTFPKEFSYIFYSLLLSNSKIYDVSNLLLPATVLYPECYSNMFRNNTSITSTPVLPAITLANGCYNSMFSGCRSLTAAPVLPATTLAQGCYEGMFQSCTSLTNAPTLPATTLAQGCYQDMFSYCSSLTNAPALPATTLAQRCYEGMFQSCTSLTTAPELPVTTLASYCYREMFRDCTSLTTAPTLPATTLTDYCYSYMFRGCTSLTTAPTLPATTLVRRCYESMFSSCTTLNNINCLATNISATNCITNWVKDVSQTGTFTKKAGITYPSGTSGIPEGWTVVEV